MGKCCELVHSPVRYGCAGGWILQRLQERCDTDDASGFFTRIALTELPTKSAARKKLAAIIEAAAEPEPEPEKKPEVKTYSTLVEEWKAAEGATLDDSTFDNYSNSLRACVLPTFKDTDIRTIIRKTVQ